MLFDPWSIPAIYFTISGILVLKYGEAHLIKPNHPSFIMCLMTLWPLFAIVICYIKFDQYIEFRVRKRIYGRSK